MSAFAKHAVVDDEFQMTTEERIKYSLEKPGARHALTPAAINKVSNARIRYNLTLIAHNLHEDVIGWVKDVASTNPAKAVELYMELLEFSVPRLKSIEVGVNDSRPLRELSIDELQRLAAEANGESAQ